MNKEVSQFDGIDQSKREVKKAKRKIVWVFVSLLFFCLLCFAIIPGYYLNKFVGDTLCGNQIIDRQANSDETYDYVVFKRDCGATTDFNYHLSIIKHNRTLENDSGNIYITDDPFTAKWTNERTIRIALSTSKAYKNEKKYKGVEIIYM